MSQYDQLLNIAEKEYRRLRGWKPSKGNIYRAKRTMTPYVDSFYEALALRTASEALHSIDQHKHDSDLTIGKINQSHGSQED
jgi:hypothetical protein